MIYLHFDNIEQATKALKNEGFIVNEYGNHFNSASAWGTIFKIPESVEWLEGDEAIETFEPGVFVNVYDCRDADLLSEFQIPSPSTPYNVIAG